MTPSLVSGRLGSDLNIQGKVVVNEGIAKIPEEIAAAEFHVIPGSVDDQLAGSLQHRILRVGLFQMPGKLRIRIRIGYVQNPDGSRIDSDFATRQFCQPTR